MSSVTKYRCESDSVQVPWGKDEKYFEKRVKRVWKCWKGSDSFTILFFWNNYFFFFFFFLPCPLLGKLRERLKKVKYFFQKNSITNFFSWDIEEIEWSKCSLLFKLYLLLNFLSVLQKKLYYSLSTRKKERKNRVLLMIFSFSTIKGVLLVLVLYCFFVFRKESYW